MGCVALLVAGLGARNATAQETAGDRQRAREEALGRLLGQVPALVSTIFQRGQTGVFRLLERLEIFRVESEIDRYVGPPRRLHDSTTYKLSLLPFHIRYPIYRQLVSQMTRLDNVRSQPIHLVSPESVSLIDLRIEPVMSLDQFRGEGAGNEVQNSLLSHFTAREIADMSVFVLAQQPFFPETDEGWQRTKRRIARASVPLALGLLATSAAFDAGALTHSNTIFTWDGETRLRYYGGFREMGFSWHPLLRAGLSVNHPRVAVAAGIADRVRPGPTQPDSSAEIAVRTGLLANNSATGAWDGFFETAVRRGLNDPPGFTGDRTIGRSGIFLKRIDPPWLPGLTLRSSAEVETNLRDRLHIVTAVGVEKPRSGIATILHGSLVPTASVPGARHDVRLNLFLVGTMEPLTAIFEDQLDEMARQARTEWTELGRIDARRVTWEHTLQVHGASTRTSAETAALLAEMEHLLNERDTRLLQLADTLTAYLEARQRAYAILGWPVATDELHGPLDASILTAARTRLLTRVRDLGADLATTVEPLLALRREIEASESEARRLDSVDPGSAEAAEQRRVGEALTSRWQVETERVRAVMTARDALRVRAARILDDTGGSQRDLRAWDGLDALVRLRLSRLVTSTPN